VADITERLRKRIVAGDWHPSERLPSQTALKREYHASHLTVQRAIHRLVEQGFVATQERSGVFVGSRLPHHHDYALIFAEAAAKVKTWSRFYTGLLNAAPSVARQQGCQLPLFFGIDAQHTGPDYERLSQLVEERRLAGLIFVQGEHYVAETPLLRQPDLVRVALSTGHTYANLPVVSYDPREFVLRAFRYFVGHGRQRVALVTVPPTSDIATGIAYHFERELTTNNLISRPYWTLHVSAQEPVAARNCVRLLMEANPSDRPDALLIADDNLVEDAVQGLISAGVRVPQDLVVVAHSNLPWAGHQRLPLAWLGFDTAHVLQLCIELLRQQQRGEHVPPQTWITPTFSPGTAAPVQVLGAGVGGERNGH